MRLYSICNMYLSSIQNGIQTQHSTVRLFRKYQLQNNVKMLSEIYDWSDNHETTIVLNGGMTEHMDALILLIEASGLPWAPFYEPGIGNAMTSISVVIPEKLYCLKDSYFEGYIMTEHMLHVLDLTREEYDMMYALKKLPLAK